MNVLLLNGISLPNTTFGALLLCVTGFLIQLVYALYFSSYHHIPGPRLCKISRYWLAYFDFTLQRNERIYVWHQKYGPVLLIAPGEVSFSTPSATREIYGAAGRYPKSDYFTRFATYGERPTFTVKEHDEHRAKRKLTFSLFQATNIYGPAYVDPIRSRVKAFLQDVDADVKRNNSLDFFARFTLYVFDNMSRFAYGPRNASHSIENECSERSMLWGLRECEIWNNRLFDFPTLYKLFQVVVSCVTNNKEFLTAEHKLTNWCSEKLAASNKDPEIRTDDSLLRYLKDVKTKDGKSLTPNYIASEMLDNLNGAQTTTTAALTYVMWNIARNRAWEDRIRKEISQLPLQEDGLPSFADVNAAPVLDACIRESYRVNPISSGRAERVTPAGKQFEGVYVPGGTIVSTSTIAMHRTASEFPNPLLYDPDRWLLASPERLRAMESVYMPFGQGTRVCIGRSLATVQIKMLIACLVLKYCIVEDVGSRTNKETMRQISTQDALPWGLRCDLKVFPVK